MKYLVMTEGKPSPSDVIRVASLLGATMALNNYNGESTARIKEQLAGEPEGTVIVSADSRMLKFVNQEFQLKDSYIFNGEMLIPLEQATKRILKKSHNLMNLYEAGEFL